MEILVMFLSQCESFKSHVLKQFLKWTGWGRQKKKCSSSIDSFPFLKHLLCLLLYLQSAVPPLYILPDPIYIVFWNLFTGPAFHSFSGLLLTLITGFWRGIAFHSEPLVNNNHPPNFLPQLWCSQDPLSKLAQSQQEMRACLRASVPGLWGIFLESL